MDDLTEFQTALLERVDVAVAVFIAWGAITTALLAMVAVRSLRSW